MVRSLLSAHVVGTALWFGGIVALLVLQRHAKAMGNDGMSGDARSLAVRTMGAVVRWILTPSAAVVLLTGPAMMVQMGLIGVDKPFWLHFMERFGGGVAVVSMVLLTWQMRKADRAASSEEQNRHLHKFGFSLTGVGAATLATIVVVMMRIS